MNFRDLQILPVTLKTVHNNGRDDNLSLNYEI